MTISGFLSEELVRVSRGSFVGCFDNSTENYIWVHFYVFSRPSIMTEQWVHLVSKVVVMKSQMERANREQNLGDCWVGSHVTGVLIQQFISNRGPEWKHLSDSFVPAVWRVWKGDWQDLGSPKEAVYIGQEGLKAFYGGCTCSITGAAVCRHSVCFGHSIPHFS